MQDLWPLGPTIFWGTRVRGGGWSFCYLGEFIDDERCVKHGVQAGDQDSAPLVSYVLVLRKH